MRDEAWSLDSGPGLDPRELDARLGRLPSARAPSELSANVLERVAEVARARVRSMAGAEVESAGRAGEARWTALEGKGADREAGGVGLGGWKEWPSWAAGAVGAAMATGAYAYRLTESVPASDIGGAILPDAFRGFFELPVQDVGWLFLAAGTTLYVAGLIGSFAKAGTRGGAPGS